MDAVHELLLEDGVAVEWALLGDRVLISSMAGCPLGCGFCATVQTPFYRPLSAEEIREQYRQALTLAQEKGGRVKVVCFDGSGEPLHNLDGVVPLAQELMAMEAGPGVELCTTAPARRLEEFARRLPGLAPKVSLHGTDRETAARWMPVRRSLGPKEVLEACELRLVEYSIRYLVAAGVTDREQDAERLASWALGRKLWLRRLDEVVGGFWKASSEEEIQRFCGQLRGLGLDAEVEKDDSPAGRLRPQLYAEKGRVLNPKVLRRARQWAHTRRSPLRKKSV